MRFSLVLATIRRVQEVERFLLSLQSQSYPDFELIVVDQNPDDRLRGLLGRFAEAFPIRHLRAKPGLSRARNLGLRIAQGEILSFPDDDCWYPPNLLGELAAFFRRHPEWQGIFGRLRWEENEQSRSKAMGSGASAPTPLAVNLYNVTTSLDARTVVGVLLPKEPPNSASSVTLFLRREAALAVQGFDKTLGLGSGTPWGGGEDVDLAIRCLRAGFLIGYCPQFVVYHPNPRERQMDPKRGLLYGAGMGRVLRKHGYPLWFVLYHLMRSLGGAGQHLLQGRWVQARYQWAVFRGKAAGWWAKD